MISMYIHLSAPLECVIVTLGLMARFVSFYEAVNTELSLLLLLSASPGGMISAQDRCRFLTCKFMEIPSPDCLG